MTNAIGRCYNKRDGLPGAEQAVIAAVMALLLIVLPAACGYLVAHLPPGTWRQQRRWILLSVLLGPALLASLAVRIALATAVDHQQSVSLTRYAASTQAMRTV